MFYFKCFLFLIFFKYRSLYPLEDKIELQDKNLGIITFFQFSDHVNLQLHLIRNVKIVRYKLTIVRKVKIVR